MKKWLFFLAALGAVILCSEKNAPGTDIAKLQPVQVIRVSRFQGNITVETDTGAWGMGAELEDALEYMHASAPTYLFLDTAEYLLIEAELQHLLPDLQKQLRPSCCVCLEDGQPDMGQVGPFLQIHSPKITVKDYLAGITDFPTLLTTQEGMLLVQ